MAQLGKTFTSQQPHSIAEDALICPQGGMQRVRGIIYDTEFPQLPPLGRRKPDYQEGTHENRRGEEAHSTRSLELNPGHYCDN